MQTEIYHRKFDNKITLAVQMIDPQLDMAAVDKLRYRDGSLPEYIKPRWVVVGVFSNYAAANKARKDWKRS